MSHQVSWKKYIDKTSDRPARPILVEALQYVLHKGSALDVGAGALMDSKHMLSEGFKRVVAIDPDPAAQERAAEISSPNFTFIQEKLELAELEPASFDLINAQRSLSYLAPEEFKKGVQKLNDALKVGGIFALQIFGERDQNILPGVDMTRPTKQEIIGLFSDMEILKIDETEEEKESTLGKLKNFHEFGLIIHKI